MEHIQRLATRMVKGMRELSYEERLHRLNFFSPERRRLRGDFILAYNTFHGCLSFPQAEFSRPQRSGTYEDITIKYVIEVSVYS